MAKKSRRFMRGVVYRRAAGVFHLVWIALVLALAGCERTAAPARLSEENFAEFVRAFDEAADRPRVLLLLSPT